MKTVAGGEYVTTDTDTVVMIDVSVSVLTNVEIYVEIEVAVVVTVDRAVETDVGDGLKRYGATSALEDVVVADADDATAVTVANCDDPARSPRRARRSATGTKMHTKSTSSHKARPSREPQHAVRYSLERAAYFLGRYGNAGESVSGSITCMGYIGLFASADILVGVYLGGSGPMDEFLISSSWDKWIFRGHAYQVEFDRECSPNAE